MAKLKVLSRTLPGRTKRSIYKYQTGNLVFRRRFKPRISQIQVWPFIPTCTVSFLWSCN